MLAAQGGEAGGDGIGGAGEGPMERAGRALACPAGLVAAPRA